MDAELKGHQFSITSIRVLNAKEALTIDRSSAMILWNLPDGAVAEGDDKSISRQKIWWCGFYPSGKKFATVGFGGGLKVWNTLTLDLEGEFEYEGPPQSCAIIFPPKGKDEDVGMIAVNDFENIIFVATGFPFNDSYREKMKMDFYVFVNFVGLQKV